MKSVLQTEKECYVCGSRAELHSHHCIYGTAGRMASEKRGYKVWLCYEHHEGNSGVHQNPNQGLDLFLKRLSQSHYETHLGTREDFIKEFGRSYL